MNITLPQVLHLRAVHRPKCVRLGGGGVAKIWIPAPLIAEVGRLARLRGFCEVTLFGCSKGKKFRLLFMMVKKGIGRRWCLRAALRSRLFPASVAEFLRAQTIPVVTTNKFFVYDL